MGKKLYCENLSYNVSSSDLEQLFSQFGTVVSAQVFATSQRWMRSATWVAVASDTLVEYLPSRRI